MTRPRSVSRAAADERGSALVIAVLVLPLLLLMGAFAVDVAGWFVHDRHLQTRADAAALAGISEVRFPACSSGPVAETERNTRAKLVARAYAGLGSDPGVVPPPLPYNQTLGSKVPDVKLAGTDGLSINKASFYGQDDKPNPPDGTDTREPCAARAVDVKLTDVDAPWYFKVFKPSFINAHARAELRTQTSGLGISPIGVENATPTEVRVWVIDEARTGCRDTFRDTCVVNNLGGGKATVELTAGSTSAGVSQWQSTAGSLRPVLTAVSKRLGLVVALSGRRSEDLNADLTEACTQSLVVCYDAQAANRGGLVFLQTYDPGAPGQELSERPAQGRPILRSVKLLAGNCTAPSGDPYFTEPCTTSGSRRSVGVEAKVDFGTGGTDPSPKSASSPTALGAKVEATVGGTTRTMTFDDANDVWRTTSNVNITSTGPEDVTLAWEMDKAGITIGDDGCSNRCGDDFTEGGQPLVAQRTFTQTQDRSGSLRRLQVDDVNTGDPLDTSFARCRIDQDEAECSPSLAVGLAVAGGLENDASSTDPFIRLRDPNGSGSTGTVSCNPAPGSDDPERELAVGCKLRYGVFAGTPSPWDQGCASLQQSDFQPDRQPYQCARVGQGTLSNQTGLGMNSRVLCGGRPFRANQLAPDFPAGTPLCTNNACPTTSRNYWRDPVKGIDSGRISLSDPRVLQLFIVPAGTFGQQNANFLPVRDIGYFYVTGWQGGGNADSKNPCQTIPPLNPLHADDPAQDGQIVGHYFRVTYAPNDGSAGTELCEPGAFGGCVTVLTR